MKTILLGAMTLALAVAPALAGEAYTEQSELRLPGVVTSTAGVKLSPYKDADPYQYRVAAAPPRAVAMMPMQGSEGGMQSMASMPGRIDLAAPQPSRFAANGGARARN
jgi:hypothetical protein